jgi:hypothetical protein
MYEKIIDLATGEELLREYTAEEIAAAEAEGIKAQALIEAETQKVTEKMALFTKLGLTAEEAAVLFS